MVSDVHAHQLSCHWRPDPVYHNIYSIYRLIERMKEPFLPMSLLNSAGPRVLGLLAEAQHGVSAAAVCSSSAWRKRTQGSGAACSLEAQRSHMVSPQTAGIEAKEL